MSMSIPYEATGRTNQKARTRAALVAAARALLAERANPTVEQAADRAAISRTTAYRYFPNQRALLMAVYPELDTPSLLDPDPPADPIERFEQALERFTRQVVDHEPELRAQLRLSLEPRPAESDQLPFRKGRAIGWFEDALAPLRKRMSARQLRRLVLAVRATTGIEALVWLTDVAGLSAEDAAELMRSSARTLVHNALQEQRHPRADTDRRNKRATTPSTTIRPSRTR
jgi:AcrR family transcriptional regulator